MEIQKGRDKRHMEIERNAEKEGLNKGNDDSQRNKKYAKDAWYINYVFVAYE